MPVCQHERTKAHRRRRAVTGPHRPPGIEVRRRDCFTPTVQAGRFSWSATNANTIPTGLAMTTESLTLIVTRGSLG